MAKIEARVAQNVRGKFYVDAQCIYCDLCVETAPTVFREFKERGWAYVFAQPASEEEERAAMDAVEGCPTESIGFDGDRHDWSKIPPADGTKGIAPEMKSPDHRNWFMRLIGRKKA